ncbi:hypothetical protein B0H14DRAFT_2695548, partial [Mycena olivaceomarginata]
KRRLALSPLALLLWELNDSIFLFYPTPFHWRPSHITHGKGRPFQQEHFTVWLHGLVNGAPAVWNYEFAKRDVGVSWRFLSSTRMPTVIYPQAISFSGHTLGYCNGYRGQAILPLVPAGKDAARRKVIDLPWTGSIHLSSFSGALTCLHGEQIVIVYYE